MSLSGDTVSNEALWTSVPPAAGVSSHNFVLLHSPSSPYLSLSFFFLLCHFKTWKTPRDPMWLVITQPQHTQRCLEAYKPRYLPGIRVVPRKHLRDNFRNRRWVSRDRSDVILGSQQLPFKLLDSNVSTRFHLRKDPLALKSLKSLSPMTKKRWAILTPEPPKECQEPFHHRDERCFAPVRGEPGINHSWRSESQLKSPYSECKRTKGNFTDHNQEHPQASWGIPSRPACPGFLLMSNQPSPNEHPLWDACPGWECLIVVATAQ